MSNFTREVLANPKESSTRGCCCDASSLSPISRRDALEQSLFIHLVPVDVLIKVSANTSKYFLSVGVICLIIHKVQFLSIKKYASVYVQAIAVECEDSQAFP